MMKPKPQTITSLSLLSVISSFFILKYASRVTAYPSVVLLCYFFLTTGILILAYRFPLKSKRSGRILLYIGLALSVTLALGLFFIAHQSRVTRLAAIEGWLGNILQHHFPYDHPVKPSGFPVLFGLALPFYLLGDAGGLEVLGFFACWVLLCHFSRSVPDAQLKLVVFLFLPTVYYEYLVRSELLFNMSLVLLLIALCEKVKPWSISGLPLIGTAILFGLVLSTRSIVAVIYGGYLMYRFKTRLDRLLVFSVVMMATFGLTLWPFILWDAAMFFKTGPFAVQSSYLPVWVAVAFALASLGMGYAANQLDDFFFLTGLLLFAVVSTSFALAITEDGFAHALFRDGFDISYYVFCTPFLILSIRHDSHSNAAQIYNAGQ